MLPPIASDNEFRLSRLKAEVDERDGKGVVLGEEEAAVVGYWLDARAAMTDGFRE